MSLRLTINVPQVTTAEIVLLVDLLDQVLAQIWREHGDDIADFMLADRRRKERERAQRDRCF